MPIDLSKDAKILSELLRQLFSASRLSIVLNLLVSALLAYLEQDIASSSAVISWFSVIVVISLLRGVLVASYQRTPEVTYAVKAMWLKRYRFLLLLSGVAWGSAGVILFAPHDPAHQMILVTMLVGLSSAAIVTLSTDLFCARVFPVAVLLPLAINLIAEKSGVTLGISLAILLYMAFLILNAKRINGSIVDNIKVTY